MRLAAALLVVPLVAAAQENIDRALLERDAKSAEFAHPELRDLNDRRAQDKTPLRPDERTVRSRERDAELLRQSPPVDPNVAPPLPLPGGPRHGVDPIPAQRVGR